ncbi:hypothetical protein [Streptomyces sp. NPDC094468]|uniref:hypothetical protein n=1 Tax=Streptomyces sp. NPDC094468 TaxID=3366066 RepID=UPI003811DBE7
MPTEVDTSNLSAECAVAQEPYYKHLHETCRQTQDIPLPHSRGILLIRRCECACHLRGRRSA